MLFKEFIEMVDDLQDMIIDEEFGPVDEEFGPELAAKVILKLGQLKSNLILSDMLIDECKRKNNSQK